MHNAFGHNYRNSSFIVDVAKGQIPRSTERMSSSKYKLVLKTIFITEAHLHYHRFHLLSLVQPFILTLRLGSLVNPFHHRPFPHLPD